MPPKIPQNKSSEDPGDKGLKDKWKEFLQATKEAGTRHDQLPFSEKARQQLWVYNSGQVRGLLKGLYEGLGHLLDPLSDFHQVTPHDIHQQVSNAGERVLDYGTEYMKADWETRGEMSGAATIKTGLWVLSLRGVFLSLKKILKGVAK